VASEPISNIGGVRLPRDKAKRPRRPIPGLSGYEITQTGQIWIEDTSELVTEYGDDWPYFFAEADGNVVKIHLFEAAAAAWLTPEQRAMVRQSLPANVDKKSAEARALIADLQVSDNVIHYLTRHAEGEIAAWQAVEPEDRASDLQFATAVSISDYKTGLIELSRPPSKGGNGHALHVHSFSVDSDRYSFCAIGFRQLAYVTDLVSFSYYLDTEGRRKILKSTLRTVDKSGKSVKRGNRGTKRTLRTATTRLPARRREWKD
jgi:hypothetical protein